VQAGLFLDSSSRIVKELVHEPWRRSRPRDTAYEIISFAGNSPYRESRETTERRYGCRLPEMDYFNLANREPGGGTNENGLAEAKPLINLVAGSATGPVYAFGNGCSKTEWHRRAKVELTAKMLLALQRPAPPVGEASA
jgi:hypothetical protein